MEDRNLPSKPAWEVDFPLDRVESEHVTRREFGKFLVLVSGGLTCGSAWVALKGSVLPPVAIPADVRLCGAADVPVGGMKAFTIPGTEQPGILIRIAEDTWRAYEQKCTHLSCAVLYKPGSDRIECPCHNGAFDAGTGDVLYGPPPRPLRSFPVSVRGDEVFLLATEVGS